MGKRLTGYLGVLGLLLVAGLSLLPSSGSTDRAQAATPAANAFLLQTISFAEKQCRIARESCLINSNRCKANDAFEARLTSQCKAKIVKAYENCASRRLKTLPPLGSNLNNGQRPSAIDIQNYRQTAVLKACGRKPHKFTLQKKCPARKGGCYSAGYCTQQYQSCSSSAAVADQAEEMRARNAESATRLPPIPAPPESNPASSTVRSRDERPAIEMRKAPRHFEVRITNTCRQPVRAAFAYNWGPNSREYKVWGWKIIPARGDTIVELPSKMNKFFVHLDSGKLDRTIQTSKTLFINHDADFDAGLNLDNRPAKVKVPEARYIYVTGSGWLLRKDYRKFDHVSIKDCKP